MTIKIPKNLPEIKEPKIPFTEIPNPLGTARIIYSNEVEQIVPLYYLQKSAHFIFVKIKLCFYKVTAKLLRLRLKL